MEEREELVQWDDMDKWLNATCPFHSSRNLTVLHWAEEHGCGQLKGRLPCGEQTYYGVTISVGKAKAMNIILLDFCIASDLVFHKFPSP